MSSKPAKTSKKSVPGMSIYQIKIALKGSKPSIWRRVLLPGDIPLNFIHHVIQIAMGWTNSHMHQFIIGTGAGTRFLGSRQHDMDELQIEDESDHTLVGLAPAPKMKLHYEYDFGDSWLHEILVEKILPPDPSMSHPICTAGENACPPEDCGGIYGYYEMLAAVADPKHPEHETFAEWVEEDFDPAEFSVAAVNSDLKARIHC
jgi:hypothetical protein